MFLNFPTVDKRNYELDNYKLDVFGISEVRWTGSGMIKESDKTVLYSGENNHERELDLYLVELVRNC